MTPRLAEYVEAGYTLTPEERLEAARLLRLSVDRDAEAEQSDVDAAWLVEIGSRLDEVREGRVELVDADETYQLISAELAARGR